ncbi:MAG: RNA polymerase sigma factor [Oscillospiraceae bacterium]|jgi:RNA polymerase sigma-70 factor (ECF subfamily)|nr:RNA polymerase sigma factor [Oscillospiraceae bacterium]
MIEPLPARGEDRPEKSFEEIYRQHFAMVYRVCFSYMKNAADAEDAAADAFLKLLKNGRVFQSAEHEKAWLLRTAINTCKDYLKHWRRSCADIADYENLQSASSFHIDETLKAVMELPAHCKAVIYLYYYEGYTTEEIAGLLKKPHATIRYHLREARNLLRGVLENEEP